MALELLFPSIIASLSFLSGALTLSLFISKIRSKSNKNEVDDYSLSPSKSTARLPSLINMEICLMIWYLMICTPSMLIFWIYLPHFHGTNDIHNILGSVIFVISFVPIYTTHIIRIWLLKLKYALTSLSMLNQLGLVKWSDVRSSIWTKIYHKHKWSHDHKILIFVCIISDIVITAIYSILLFIDIRLRFYLNLLIFGTLTLCVFIGVYSLKSFNDPFNIFREEIIILLTWLIALIIYAIFYIFHYVLLANNLLTESELTITVTLFGAIAAFLSIFIHFHYDKKSQQVIKDTVTTLPIIVSTKDGLQTFLKFLVTELSVENLEFFTLSMRWRHRLVLRDLRRQRKMRSRPTSPKESKNKESENEVTPQPTPTRPRKVTFAAETEVAEVAEAPSALSAEPRKNVKINMLDLLAVNSLNSISPSSSQQETPQPTNKSVLTATGDKLLAQQKRTPAHEAETHLPHLPFPLLTFEFLDRDVIKDKHLNSPMNNRRNRAITATETSYVVEFSKTKTCIQPTLTLREDDVTPDADIIPSSQLETPHSIYFEQYAAMTLNRRKITELSELNASFAKNINSNTTPQLITKMTTDSFLGTGTDTLRTLTDRQRSDNDGSSPGNKLHLTRGFSRSSKQVSLSKSELSSKLKNISSITPFTTYATHPSDKSAEHELNNFMLGQAVLKEESENFGDERSCAGKGHKVYDSESIMIYDQKEKENEISKFEKIDVDSDGDLVKSSNMFKMIDRLNVLNVVDKEEKKKEEDRNVSPTNSNKKRNEVTFGGWFEDDAFGMYDEEWTDEFMSKKRVHYDRFVNLSQDINVSAEARTNMKRFFEKYETVKMFRKAEIAQYDIAFEVAWKDVWHNLNDSLRRFHHSKYYQEWLQSNAADGLNVMAIANAS